MQNYQELLLHLQLHQDLIDDDKIISQYLHYLEMMNELQDHFHMNNILLIMGDQMYIEVDFLLILKKNIFFFILFILFKPVPNINMNNNNINGLVNNITNI